MAVIWQKIKQQKRYEVRRAGKSVRLYTNGVFHSQYNPNNLGRGSLWDILAMPSLLLNRQAINQALVLGVGGGAAIKYLHQYKECKTVIGVDLDSTHLHVAKRFFALDKKHNELIFANAVDWLVAYSGEPFDFIIDDLFGENIDEAGLPIRAVPVTPQWLNLLLQNLAPGGVLVLNLESLAQATKLKKLAKSSLKNGSFFTLSHQRYENAVAVLVKGGVNGSFKKQLLSHVPERLKSGFKIIK